MTTIACFGIRLSYRLSYVWSDKYALVQNSQICYHKVVEEGSMNEAAQKLYVARSSLSTSMKNLEAELGALIFERTTRGVMLTAFGRDVYHQAQDICQRFAYLQNAPKTS